ncbi:MAG: hypothetical protein K2M11_02095 [Paramuribaculum sp.]|nr:hypothetical protein [Paramuribaculum sp.]
MKECIITLLIFIYVCFSCGKKDSINVTQERDNEIDVSELIEEFPVDSVLIHAGARFYGSNRYLYIKDSESTDKITSVFLLPDGKYMGQFMDFGAGPNEVASAGSISVITSPIDGREKALLIDHGNYRIYGYDVDSALTDSTYTPISIKPLDELVMPSRYIYINDTLGFARKIVLHPGSPKFDQSLGKYNLKTGELIDFALEEHIAGNQSVFTVSEESERVIEAGTNIDIVVIYDYDGNVVKRIKGPNYKPKAEGRKSYFSNVKIAGPYILGVYSGGDWYTADYIGKNIEVWDLDGNYIATLNMGKRIRDMYYHNPSGILWLSIVEDDMVFGKLNLEEAMKKGKKIESTAKNDVADTLVSSETDLGTIPPFVFLTDDGEDTLTCFDIGEVKIPKDLDEVVYPEESKIVISSGNFKNLPGKVEKIWLEPTTVTPKFLTSKIDMPYLIETMLTLVQIGFTKDTPEGEFKGMVEIPAKGFSEPVKLPISGKVVYK